MPGPATLKAPVLVPLHVDEKLVPAARDTPVLPTQPTLRAIANDVIGEIKYATAANASNEGGSHGSLDHILHDFLSSRTPEAQKAASAHSRTLLEGTEAQRAAIFGRYATVPVAEYLSAGSDSIQARLPKLNVTANQVKVDLTALRSHLITLAGAVPPPKPDPDLQAGLAFKKMRFFIRAVRCIEETDEWSESDEINMGAVVADPLGNTWIDPQFQVSDDFDAGEVVTYAGLGHKLTGWNLVTSEPWPHVYAVTLCMAEKDDGGFAKFLKELWDYIDDKINALITAGLGAAIGAELGGIIGAVVGAVLGLLVGWIISLFDDADDILGAKVLTMTLASAKKSYYDWAQLTSANGWTSKTNFYGDGGHYRVAYGWKVFTQ
jgi:hypothetical protein